jgi:hypothetical protein
MDKLGEASITTLAVGFGNANTGTVGVGVPSAFEDNMLITRVV